jgi:hypothetical protein
MLTLRETADDLCGNLVSAGFKPPPSHHGFLADCSVLDSTREKPGLNNRA